MVSLEKTVTATVGRERRAVRALGVRSIDLRRNFDIFLTCAVAGVLGNRFFLVLTGYPQVGNGTLHISHAIWGGLMMVAAILLALGSIAPAARPFVAFLGGAGLGWFVDELGKFITRDVNYFFRPTLALIYVIFIGLYLVSRVVQRRRFRPEEGLLNGLEALKAAAVGRLDEHDRQQALALLDETRADDPLSQRVRDLLDDVTAHPPPAPGRFMRLLHRLQRPYERWSRRRGFTVGLSIVLGLLALSNVANVVVLTVTGPGVNSFTRWATVVSAVASLLFAVVGMVLLTRARLRALRWFEASVLVSVFVTQVFLFADKQLAAVVDLTLTFVVWVGVRSLIRLELLARSIHDEYVRARRAEGSLAPDDPALADWDALPETLRASNRDQAEHIESKLGLVGCELVPAAGAPVPFQFTPEEIEALARIEHDRWMTERERAGWRYGDTRDPAAKTTPYLVPWEDLTEEIRDRDRETIRELPLHAARTGQRIVRIPARRRKQTPTTP